MSLYCNQSRETFLFPWSISETKRQADSEHLFCDAQNFPEGEEIVWDTGMQEACSSNGMKMSMNKIIMQKCKTITQTMRYK